MIQTLDDAFTYFEARTNLEKGLPPGNPNRVYRLDRMSELCRVFGNPQDLVRTVHIAGSKGKGSTAAYISALLNAAGRRVGIYSSPHLLDYRERFRIEGAEFPEARALKTANNLIEKLPLLEKYLPGDGPATTFELLTLFAFLFFRDTGCDTTVLETGLGGRLDATNVVLSPEAVIITAVEMEHTEILGDRLTEIAAEKAGIIKPGTEVWLARQKRSARRVFLDKAKEAGSDLTELNRRLSRIRSVSVNPGDSRFQWQLDWKNGRKDLIHLTMGGKVQAENAALALLAGRELESSLAFGGKNAEAGISALEGVNLPGRFQFLRRRPAVIIDGAHTPRSIAALAEAFVLVTADSSPESPILVFGSVAGKDHRAMAAELCRGRSPIFHDVIISTPGSFKQSSPEDVAESFRSMGAAVSLIRDPATAWRAALKLSDNRRPILVTGSFFMAAEIAGLADNHVTAEP